jgi:hypothetical protein
MRIVGLAGGRGIELHRDACLDLAAHACEANVFYKHWMLEPAPAEWACPGAVDVIPVYEDDVGQVGRLCGLFPVERRAVSHRRSLPWIAMWIAFDHVSLDGPFAALLEQALECRGRSGAETERFERALAKTTDSADAFVRQALNDRRRHEIARHERRLHERGEVRFGSLPPDDPAALEVWLERFLSLESPGLKGRAGSAIAGRPDERRFLLTAARNAYAVGQPMILSLELAGRPIALEFKFLTQSTYAGGFALKIAFDESLSEYSPGMILKIENVRRIHDVPRLSWMDSCAQLGHPMMDRIWRARRTIGDVLTSIRRPGAEAALRGFAALRNLKRLIAATGSRFRMGRRQARA